MRVEHDVTDRAAELCDQLLTPQNVEKLLRGIADTPGPSGTSSLTRGRVVADWVTKSGLDREGALLSLDFERTGCDVLRLGTGGLRMLAHLDEISYLLDGPADALGRWPLQAYCYHLAEKPAPARVIRFFADGTWTVHAEGRVVTDGTVYFEPDEPTELAAGDRVVLASPLAHDQDTGLVTGSLDNAAGATAALLAAAVLTRLGVPFEVVLTDEEEGPAGASSQTISRGAMRYFQHADDAPLNVAIDIHGVPDSDLDDVRGHAAPWGASLAEFSSAGRGSVAPPQLYAGVTDLFADSPMVTRVRKNVGGYVPRSDDVVAMTHSSRVLILGYPGVNRHFDRGLPAANVADLAELARALVVLGIGVAQGSLAVDW